jgi:hypothetical protein
VVPKLIQNPALKPLERLVGSWDVEIVFPTDSPGIVHGRVSFAELEGGTFLVMRSEVDEKGPPNSVSVIGRDDSGDTYSMLYADERGVSRTYEMSFENGAWKLWRNAPDFSQRFSASFDESGNVMTAQWEKSTDGNTWEHDFDLTYRRTS